MKAIVVNEAEFKRAFEEALLKIEKSFRDSLEEDADADLRFRTVNFYVRELQSRLEGGKP